MKTKFKFNFYSCYAFFSIGLVVGLAIPEVGKPPECGGEVMSWTFPVSIGICLLSLFLSGYASTEAVDEKKEIKERF